MALGVAVGERAPDEHLVVGEVEAVDEHARPEGDLLVLGEDVAHVAIEHHAPHGLRLVELLGPDLRVVERVEVELGVLAVGHDLHAKLPLRVVAALDGGAEVLGVGAEVVGLDGGGVGGGPARTPPAWEPSGTSRAPSRSAR